AQVAPGSAANPFLFLGADSTLATRVSAAQLAGLSFRSARLNWQPLPASPSSATAEGYLVQVSTASDFSMAVISSATADISLSTLSVAGLSAQTTYYFRVGALNWQGAANFVTLSSAVTPAASPTPAGCGLTVFVRQDGGGDALGIQEALGQLPVSLSTTTCVVVADAQTYAEQVTVRGFANNGYRLQLSAAPGVTPVLSPPALSTAAFLLQNASVTVQGFAIRPANPLPYGVRASSAMAAITVDVIDNNQLQIAAVALSSFGVLSNSSITVQAAHGVYIDGTMNQVVDSTAIAVNPGQYPLFVNGGSLNTFDHLRTDGYVGVYLLNTNGNAILRSSMSASANQAVLSLSGSNLNTVSLSTFTGGFHGVNTTQSSSNTFAWNSISNLVGPAAMLIGSGINNAIDGNAIVGTNAGLVLDGDLNIVIRNQIGAVAAGPGLVGLDIAGSSNTVADNFVSGPVQGYGLQVSGHGNVISQSTITDNGGDYALFFYENASYGNLVLQSSISNASGRAVGFWKGASNAVIQSTVTGGGNAAAIESVMSQFSFIADSFIQGSTGVYVSASTGTIVTRNRIAAAGGDGLRFDSSYGLAATSNTISAGRSALFLDSGNGGVLNLSSGTILGGKYGLTVAAQAPGAALEVNGMTFRTLTPGATAINFLGGTFASDFSNVDFADASIGLAVDASLLTGSDVRMMGFSGPKGGSNFELDPGSQVQWISGTEFAFTGTFASPGGALIVNNAGDSVIGAGIVRDTITAGGGSPYSYELLAAFGPLLPNGFFGLVKYDASGAMITSATVSGSVQQRALAVDRLGDVYVGFTDFAYPPTQAFILKLDPGLAPIGLVQISTFVVGAPVQLLARGDYLYAI
ncbi:MAG: right-handed parallel beta-helix repeat-containing protein, partial [Elusimicrobia bacterium]|nr:right-handed parallel beta-helix repeat-containing protein [Elusimicrobiota bacterium]